MGRVRLIGLLALAWLAAGCGGANAPPTKGAQVRVVYQREPYESGKSFGSIGQYERISGTMYGEVDPTDPHNNLIVDIDKAPRNERGHVGYEAQFVILRPTDASKANGTLIHTVPNRGNAGGVDDFRLRQGFTLSWVAWQGDVLPGNNRLLMKVPVATNDGTPIVGRIRTEYTVEVNGIFTTALGSGAYTGDSHDTYEAVGTSTSTATLTMREYEKDSRVPLPSDQWMFARCPTGVKAKADGGGGASQLLGVEPSTRHLCLPAGFKRGWIYELIYDAKNPTVMGLGLSSTRDFLSFVRFSAADTGGTSNPLFAQGKSIIGRVIMTGNSQTGRYCRQFLHLGFNVDVENRPVVEGLWPHITTARLPLNMRFAAPGRGFVQHEEHLFPSYEFPFAYNVMKDAFSDRVDGVLRRCTETNSCPKIIHSVSGSEYWQERASLNTTDALGKQDLVLPDNVRFYFLASTQHGSARPGTHNPLAKHPSNPNPQADSMRALLVAFDRWIRTGAPPPPSMHPRLSDGTLVMPDRASTGFPKIPGVTYNGVMNELPVLDFGPEFLTKGIITHHPPKQVDGQWWRPLVPKVDADGNDIAGIRSVQLLAPIGTYTGWNLRSKAAGAENELYDLQGSFSPFERTRAARIAKGDPRPSLEERYGTHAGYVTKVRAAAADLTAKGLLLQEDAERIIKEAEVSDILR